MNGLFENDNDSENRKTKKEKQKYPPEFVLLWNAYKNKGAKAEALKQWKVLTQGMQAITKKSWQEWIVERATLYRSIIPTEHLKFTKDLERWLSKGVFEFDERELRGLWGVQSKPDPALRQRREHYEQERERQAEEWYSKRHEREAKP